MDLKIKLVFAEFLIHRPRATNQELWAPDLTEVLLATLLKGQGMPYSLATYSDLFDQPASSTGSSRNRLRFVSTTFLRDLSELVPLLRS